MDRDDRAVTAPPNPAARFRGDGAGPVQAGTARETNGITSRLVLLYVERVGGREAVAEVLRRARLEGREEQLRDENYWFSWDEKIALFESAEEVLDDPQVMTHVGEVALDLNVGEGLKLALRALGSPRLVYQNVVRANAKFTGSHVMELLELGSDHARIRYRDRNGRGYHPLDCQYNRGMLACVPGLFGLPFAHISHPVCGCRGADACVYELRWENTANDVRFTLGCTALGGAAVLGTVLLAPAAIPVGVAGAVVAMAVATQRVVRHRSSRWRRLEREVREQSEVAERLTGSLQDLVSELQLDEVLAKVTKNARSAVGGKEFALLVDEGGVRSQSSTGVPRGATATLERWAADAIEGLQEPVIVDDVSRVPSLAPLAEGDNGVCFGSICAAPLVFRGLRLGVLVALATQARTFLPQDVDLIQSYAAQAAIALANARLYEAQQDLARRDPLTGLLNHRAFHESVAAEIERGRRYGVRFSVVLFDLDHFKRVNDAGGHAAGDRILQAAGAAMAHSSRAADDPFRIGGDEFALVLPETGAEEATACARRARDALAALPDELRASFGVAVWPDDAADKDDLLERADSRLYLMKGGAG
jgi:diguanylate cyclase (GGDEF)-like protein